MTIRTALISDKLAWDTAVRHPLQTWAWGDFRASMGIDVERLTVLEKNKIIDGWQITFHKVPFTNYTIGYFPKGPQPTKEMLLVLHKIGKMQNAIFIQLEPDVPRDDKTRSPEGWKQQLQESHHPLFTKYTFVLDLTKSEDQLQSQMHSKTRYNIKIAQKHGVQIARDDSDKTFREYLRLSTETINRQKFYAHNRIYQRNMWNYMKNAGLASLWTASYKREILAAWIIFAWKDTLYYPYGASSRNYKEVMAPNLLLWEVVKWGKAQGYKKFDLWGAMGPEPDVNDPWYGFHKFKMGYNPELVEYCGSFDYILRPLFYKIYRLADIIRWKFLKLRSEISRLKNI